MSQLTIGFLAVSFPPQLGVVDLTKKERSGGVNICYLCCVLQGPQNLRFEDQIETFSNYFREVVLARYVQLLDAPKLQT